LTISGLPRAIELLEQACSLSAKHGSAEAVIKQNVTLASLYALSGQKQAASQLLSRMLEKNQQQGFEMPEVTEEILTLLRICEPDDGSAA
jgi:thioredoxin-like negative regulator of GroEL